MHVEFFNESDTTKHCFYVIQKKGEAALSYWHPQIKSELLTYPGKMNIHDLVHGLRPMVEKLLNNFNYDTRWRIRLFEFTENQASFTRTTNVLEEFVTGDINYIDGVKQYPLIHPSWSIKN